MTYMLLCHTCVTIMLRVSPKYAPLPYMHHYYAPSVTKYMLLCHTCITIMHHYYAQSVTKYMLLCHTCVTIMLRASPNICSSAIHASLLCSEHHQIYAPLPHMHHYYAQSITKYTLLCHTCVTIMLRVSRNICSSASLS